MYPEFVVDEADWRSFVADRRGCVVGAQLARRFGWKKGDRVPLQGTIFSGHWEFEVRAVYRGSRPQDDETQFWMQHAYLDEKGPEWWRGLVGWYVVRVTSPDAAGRVAHAIDAEFANSASETRTQTESAFAAAFMRQMGNIEFLLVAIGSVVFFTLLLVTGNTMAIAVRERTGELAILKALGYTDRFVLVLVLAESLLVAGVGGGLGLWLAHRVAGTDLTRGILLLHLPLAGLATGFAMALFAGLLAGLVPAVSAGRLRVVDALRQA
jgi:putative ABC transport system permease protein